MRRLISLALAGVLALLAGCGSSSTSTPSPAALPTASDLVSKSAAAMRTVTSAHFTLAVTGSLPTLGVQTAEGDLTSAGDAKGTATITQLGQLIEVEFVVVAKDLYLKTATGGFTKIPAALANQVYDPTAILNPDKGVAKVLASTTGLSATTSSGSGYAVTGTVPKDVAAALAPGITTDVTSTATFDAATSRLTSVTFALDGADSKPATVALALSDFDAAVTITAPQ